MRGSVRLGTAIAVTGVSTAALMTATGITTAAPAAGAGQLMLIFSRSIWQEQYPKCSPTPTAASENLGTINAKLASMGVPGATASVVVNYTQTAETCGSTHMLYASQADLLGLQSAGWNIISASKDHIQINPSSTTQQIQDESCNTIPTLRAEGFTHPESQFDYPSGNHTTASQQIVAGCFDFARFYRTANTFTATSAAAANWLVPAYSTIGNGSAYTPVATLAHEMTPPAGTATEVQT